MDFVGDVIVSSLLFAIDRSSSSVTANASVKFDRQQLRVAGRVLNVVPLENVLGGAIAGTILLLFIVFVLYRLGFFVRNRPDFGIIQEMKRQREEEKERRKEQQLIDNALLHEIDLDEPMQAEPYYDHC